ncbi:MAG TPA: DUF4337 domain-containing protein [Flavipsychrobacter sp.]|nr:DUF4337 domain-containing protein [Flavipsychrobacter sp.]
MEEMEVPTEHLQEKIHEQAEERKEKWSFYVALSTALMAVFAAVSSLLAGDHANEALISQVKASDQWAYYQAKGIKSEIAAATAKIIISNTNKTSAADSFANAKYEQQKEQIRKSAEANESDSEYHLGKHKTLARAVTLFQVAIAISAISILSKKRSLWVLSVVLAIVGIGFLVQALL